MVNFSIGKNGEASIQFLKKGIRDFNAAREWIKNLPYGRNRDRADYMLVFQEEKGTCSTKHAVLKQLAIENNAPGVLLFIGLYRMNTENTPGIGQTLVHHNLSYIPEAHCYLSIEGNRLDLTLPESSFNNIQNAVLEEIPIEPGQIGNFKVNYHQDFLRKWSKERALPFDFVWKAREECISALSGNFR